MHKCVYTYMNIHIPIYIYVLEHRLLRNLETNISRAEIFLLLYLTLEVFL